MEGKEENQTKKGQKYHEKKHHENKKPKHQKHEKHERSKEYERNGDLITEDTQLPPLPKKSEHLPKPNIDDYKEKEKKNREKIGKLIDQKKQIRTEKYQHPKIVIKGEGEAFSQFEEEVEEFNEIKQRFKKVNLERNNKRNELHDLIEEAKKNNENLKLYRDAMKGSRQNIRQRLQRMQHRLLTDQLSKQQEKQLNHEIMVLSRKCNEASSSENYENKLAIAEETKERLDQKITRVKEDKEPFEIESKELKEQLDSKNKVIEKIKGQMKTETDLKSDRKGRNEKEREDWKDAKKKRLDDIQQKIKKIDEQTEKIWDEYYAKKDAYWEQKHKFDFIEWQHKVKNRKINDKLRQKRRQEAEQKQKEREKQEQKKKYINEIQLCNFLINYLVSYKKDFEQDNKEKKDENAEQSEENIKEKMASDSQWKKEKGLEVLHSKKSRQDEEPVKKGKKYKKKKQQKVEEKKFQIPFNVQVMFESLKLLSPESLQEVDKKVIELKEREAVFDRACQQEVSEEDNKIISEIKGIKVEEKKVEENLKVEEFPVLA